MNRRSRALLLPLCLLPAACVKAPPVLHPTSVPAPAVPVPPALTDDAQFGYVRAHQLVRLADRVGAGGLVNVAGSRGVDLRALDPEKPMVVVVGDPGPGGGVDKLPVTGLLPVSPGGAMAQRIAAIVGPDHVASHGGGVAVSLNAPSLEKAYALLDTLAGAPLGADVELYVRVTSLMARYGNMVHDAIAKVEQQMASQKDTGMDAGVAKAYGDWLRGIVDGSESIALHVAAGESALVVGSVSLDRAAIGQKLPSSAESMGDLGRFVPPGDFRFEGAGKNFTKMMDIALRFYESALKDDPQALADMRQILTSMTKGRYQAAMSMSLIPERFFHATMISLVDDAGDKFEAARKALGLLGRPGMQAGFAKAGFEMKATVQQNARQIEGWPVDHVTYEFKFNENNKSPELAQLFSKPMEVDVMRIGSYLVYEFNGAPGSFDKIVADLLSGNGPHPSLSARADHPAGGFLYFDIDAARLLESVRGIVKESKRNDVPRLDPSMPRITTFGYDAGGTTWYRTNVPLRLIEEVRRIADRESSKGGAYLPAPKD